MARRKSNMNCSLNNLLIIGLFALGVLVSLNYLNPIIEGALGSPGEKLGSIEAGGMTAADIGTLTANDDNERTTNMSVALEQARAAKTAAAAYASTATTAATTAKNASTPDDAETAANAAKAAADAAALEALRAEAANTLATDILTAESAANE